MTDKKRYLYCLIKKPDAFNKEIYGISGKKIELVTHEDISAVTSPVENDPVSLNRENITSHDTVLRAIMTHYSPLLPISFGTIAQNEKSLKDNLLVPNYQQFMNNLSQLDNLVEIDLRAVWFDMRDVLELILQKNVSLREAREKMLSSGLNHNESISIGKMVLDEINQNKNNLKLNLLEELKSLAATYKEGDIFAEEMILNLYFMVPKNKENDFEKKVNKIKKDYKKKNILLRSSGPVPPANFVNFSFSSFPFP